MIRAVLFDLDGTLADTAPDLGDALNRLLAEEGRPALAAGIYRPYVSQGSRGLLGIGFGLGPGDDAYAALQKRFLAYYEARLCEGTRLFEGMAELIEALERKDIAWGVVTNKPARFTLPLMERLGLRGRAASIVSGDSTVRPKPAPDPLLLACAEAGVPPTATLFVGDDLRDIQAGKAARTGTVAAAYGYLSGETPLDDWGADARIDHPLELLSLL